MPAITDPDQYRFVIERLAEGEMPADIAVQVNRIWPSSAFKETDCAALARDKLNADWQLYFDVHRAAFKAGEPTADVDFRIALLGKWAREEAGRGARANAAKYLEQIAKEQAGFFAGKAPTGGGGVPNDPLAAGGTIVVEHQIVDPKIQGQQSDPAGVRPAAPAETV